MEKLNEKLKKRISEEIQETCVKKEFLKHEKTEYNISDLEKTLLSLHYSVKFIKGISQAAKGDADVITEIVGRK